MRKIIVLFICILFAFISCRQEPSTTSVNNSVEPTYTPDIAWTLETNNVETWGEPAQYGQYLYLTESTYIYRDVPKTMRLTKIDLATGQYIWKTETVNDWEQTSARKCGQNIYVQTKPGLMLCYSDTDGSLLATIQFGITPSAPVENMSYTGFMITYDNYLYWTNVVEDFSRPYGVMRFDTSLIDFSKDKNSIQIILPELVWDTGFILASPIEENGLIYFITYNKGYTEGKGYSVLIALDAITKEIKWQRELPHMKGLILNSLFINGDNLHVIDIDIACFNRFTGNTVYEKIQSEEDLQHETSLGGSSFLAGIYESGGLLYYTTQAGSSSASITGRPEKYNKNIICIDAKTGKYIWGDMPPGGGSLGTRPIVAKGRAYVVTDCGLRVYEADSGKLIGVDKSVANFGRSLNALYDGKVIYFNNDYKRRVAVLTAIRAE